MILWWQWLVFGIVLALGAINAGLLRREWFVKERQLKEARRESFDDGYNFGLVSGRAEITNRLIGQQRYQVTLFDWGSGHDDMRWRWMITDADAAIKGELNNLPIMLGNAPTRVIAEAEALDWLSNRGINSVVISK